MKYSGHHPRMEFRIPTKVCVQNRCCRYFFARLIVWQNDEYFKKLPSTRRWSQSINNETLSSRVNQLYPQPLKRSPLFILKKRALSIYVAHRSPLKSANHCPTQDQKRIKWRKNYFNPEHTLTSLRGAFARIQSSQLGGCKSATGRAIPLCYSTLCSNPDDPIDPSIRVHANPRNSRLDFIGGSWGRGAGSPMA